MLTIALPGRDDSPRWKEVLEPYLGRFIHHLELYSINEIDKDVRNWMREAFLAAM